MNNSRFAIDKVDLSLEEPKDRREEISAKEAQLIRVIEAIVKIQASHEWSTLKSLVFESRIVDLEKRLIIESEKLDLKDSVIYRLQGRLFEARKYDLDKLVESFRLELTNIRKLTPPTER